MGYENDPYRDEDGEPLMDYDDGFQSDHGDDNQQPQHLVDENLEDELEDNDWNNDRQNRSPTPVYNDSDSKSKPRKRLIKKSNVEESVPDFVEDLEDDVAEFVRDGDSDGSGGGKRKKMDSASGGSAKKKKFSSGKFTDRGGERDRGGRNGEKSGSKSKGNGKRRSGEDAEVKEMWETVAGGDSEDDKDGPRLADDDNFIDDTGVDPGDRYGSDQGGYSPSRAPQAEEGEEDDEIRDMFKVGKKKKKTEKSAAEIALLVENVMAELEVVAEEDAELNRRSKPAINKLRKLPLLTEVLSKKQLQLEFLDHGVLTLLRNWLEPLPDGSLPNINIRAAILRILTEFPIDLDQYDRREQLKKSGLGKVIMFLSKSDEETTSNRKLAKDLVDKWSRPIFNKSTRFEDMRNFEDERMPIRRPSMKKPMNKSSGMQSRDDDLDLAEYSQEPKSGSSSSSSRLTSRPEAMSLDFVVRPQSKIDPDEVRARAKQVVQDQRRLKMNKRLQQLKAPKKKQLQATKLSVEGRGMMNKRLQQLKAPKKKQLQATKLSVEGRGMVKYL
nr:protein IWS1 homolog 1 [Tanacetum cinerariifolium]